MRVDPLGRGSKAFRSWSMASKIAEAGPPLPPEPKPPEPKPPNPLKGEPEPNPLLGD